MAKVITIETFRKSYILKRKNGKYITLDQYFNTGYFIGTILGLIFGAFLTLVILYV